VHVSASEFETLGNTVLEAHACGIPVVVPRTQGFCDTVKHEIDGFLFAPADSADARRFIDLLKRDKPLAKKMGNEGKQNVSTRAISHVVADLLDWYAFGIKRRHSRSLGKSFFSLCLLAVFIPTGVVLLALYDIIMYLLAAVGYSPIKKEKAT
jgi:Glycosyl transferases group 1